MPDQSTSLAEAAGETDANFAVMTVCTMNICRSPAMQYILERDMAPLVARFGITANVSSAGIQALVGAPSCDISLAMVGQADRAETARLFTLDPSNRPDLILGAARSHVSAAIGFDPKLRSITFTLLQACRLADWIVNDGPLEMGIRKLHGEVIDPDRTQPLTLTPALPAEVGRRLVWLVSEMDAARGLPPLPLQMPEPHHVDDIPDPHILGYNLHRMSADLILDAMATFNRAVDRVLSA
ncbi:MAG: hypothetical protein KAZ48_09595 [Candidatus Nanopelagicales bacterium]|nr:hypothetical protein [Candidatus Nanopelagicales bacterium]